jgi:hypothetical protein
MRGEERVSMRVGWKTLTASPTAIYSFLLKLSS